LAAKRDRARLLLDIAKWRRLKRISDRAANRYDAPCAGRVSAAGLALTSGEVATQFQLDSSRADSAVRVRYAQPRSRVCENARLIPAVLRPVVFGPGRPENDRNWKER
jgi:hypothetical protein